MAFWAISVARRQNRVELGINAVRDSIATDRCNQSRQLLRKRLGKITDHGESVWLACWIETEK